MIEAHGLVKRYGSTTAVDDLSFSIRPGLVTGFLGPNGAGKSTSLRVLLGLDPPTSGNRPLIDGKRYRDLPATPATYGWGADRRGAPNPGPRTVAASIICSGSPVSNRIPPPPGRGGPRRAVGLTDAAKQRVRSKYSLGMRQRLASPPPCSVTLPC